MLYALAVDLEKPRHDRPCFDDTRRICPPSHTLEKMEKLFPAFGITRVANITGLDKVGVPVYAAYRPNSRSLSVSQGKGYSHDAAKASAVMETIEAYHAERIDLPLKLGSYSEMALRTGCIDVTRLPQLKNGAFSVHKRMLWVEGMDLFTHKPKWVPFECVHSDYRTPLPEGHGCFVCSSNGLSSGNSYHESLIHGLCEVIERDALTLWSLKSAGQQQRDKLALETITDPRVVHILERFHDAQLHVGIWDITSDIGIPAFLCRILPVMEPDVTGVRPASGMGCHLSSKIALLRAVTEAAQSRLTFISGARDDMSREDYAKHLSKDQYQYWLERIRQKGLRRFAQAGSVETATLNDDLALLLAALRRQKIEEAVAVNLTKEEFSIPVTRVIVPGLETALASQAMMLGERAGRILEGGQHD